MMRRLMMLVILACTIGEAAAGAQERTAGGHVWGTYANARFQYAICYPEDLLQPQGESENGDGQSFIASDGAQLIVYGWNNVLGDRLKDVLADTGSRLAGAAGKVTYKVLKANWFVVSGQNGNVIFYAKTRYSHDQFKSFELTYDRAAAPVYEPLIGQLVDCFADLAS